MMQFHPEELIIKAEELKRMAARLIEQSDKLIEAYENLTKNEGAAEGNVKKTGSPPVLKFPRRQ
jgi:hypothetical protein